MTSRRVKNVYYYILILEFAFTSIKTRSPRTTEDYYERHQETGDKMDVWILQFQKSLTWTLYKKVEPDLWHQKGQLGPTEVEDDRYQYGTFRETL